MDIRYEKILQLLGEKEILISTLNDRIRYLQAELDKLKTVSKPKGKKDA